MLSLIQETNVTVNTERANGLGYRFYAWDPKSPCLRHALVVMVFALPMLQSVLFLLCEVSRHRHSDNLDFIVDLCFVALAERSLQKAPFFAESVSLTRTVQPVVPQEVLMIVLWLGWRGLHVISQCDLPQAKNHLQKRISHKSIPWVPKGDEASDCGVCCGLPGTIGRTGFFVTCCDINLFITETIFGFKASTKACPCLDHLVVITLAQNAGGRGFEPHPNWTALHWNDGLRSEFATQSGQSSLLFAKRAGLSLPK